MKLFSIEYVYLNHTYKTQYFSFVFMTGKCTQRMLLMANVCLHKPYFTADRDQCQGFLQWSLVKILIWMWWLCIWFYHIGIYTVYQYWMFIWPSIGGIKNWLFYSQLCTKDTIRNILSKKAESLLLVLCWLF